MFKGFNKQQKIISLLLSLAMVLTALPLAGITAFAQTHTSGNFEYEVLEDGTAEITLYKGSETALEIPSTLDNYTVTSLGILSFQAGAFESVTIPETLKNIGPSAFQRCEKLKSITIPAGVESIDSTSFEECAALEEITVDGDNKNYSSQEGVLFNKNMTELIQYPVGNARETYDIPDGVTSIGDWAFCISNLTGVTIPQSVESIGEGTFQDCYYLKQITIPNGVVSIGNSAFFNSGLTSVKISESVTSIGDSAFCNCTNLTEITADENSKSFSSKDGVLFNKDGTELVCYPFGNARTEYAIPDGVEIIGDWAFSRASLTGVTIPDSVKTIGDSAFCACEQLTSVIIPGSVETIGPGAFETCTSLTSVVIKNGVKHIGEFAFGWCDSLMSIIIPRTVVNIDESAFDNCTSLAVIMILNKNCAPADFSIPAETAIYSYEGSLAQQYAEANGNEFVATKYTISDAKYILQHVAKLVTIDEEEKVLADLNNDGDITIVDAKWVLQIIVGLRDEATLEPINYKK